MEKAKYNNDIFCPYGSDTERVYECEEQVGSVSVDDCRTFRAFSMRLRASYMTLEPCCAYCALYFDRPLMYLKDSWMYCASLSRSSPHIADCGNEIKHHEYDSHAVNDE